MRGWSPDCGCEPVYFLNKQYTVVLLFPPKMTRASRVSRLLTFCSSREVPATSTAVDVCVTEKNRPWENLELDLEPSGADHINSSLDFNEQCCLYNNTSSCSVHSISRFKMRPTSILR